MKNQWANTGDYYRLNAVSYNLPKLPPAIYKLEEDRAGFYLAKISDKFTLPEKIYGMERPFIERVKKSWASTVGNMGVLLNGLRGTGKTVTAEIISNEMNLPVIVISQAFEETLISFINDLQDDCIIFFDEYDKTFEKKSSLLLTVMDGVLKTDIRIMFLLTTNEDILNNNMYQRPSRIRYIKKFGNLDADVVMEIVEDLLEPKELKVDTINFISELSIITIDLVKTIIQEVNIHKETPYNFSDVFNVHGNERLYKVTQLLEDGTMEVLFPRCMLDSDYVSIPFSNMDIGNSIYLNGKYQGSIREIVNATTVDVERRVEKSGDESMETRRLNFSLQSRVHYSFKGKSIGL